MKKIVLFALIALSFCLQAQNDCEPPTNLKIINNGDRLSLLWNGSDNAVNYQLYWEKAPDLPFFYYSETTETYIDTLPYMARLDNSYYVVSQCADGSESISDTITVSGGIALDYTLVDCHGNEHRVYDILDQGQYIFITCFEYYYGGSREIMPYIEEAYRYYGCNTGDVFFMEIAPGNHDDLCLLWEEEFGVEYPTIGMEGGSHDFTWMYGILEQPHYAIIAPDHTIAYTTGLNYFYINSFQSIKDAFDLFGIEKHQCDIVGDCEPPTNLNITNKEGRLSLSWNGSENAVNYQLYWCKSTAHGLPFYYYPYVEITGTYIESLPYMAAEPNGYYVVSQCADGSESISDTITVPANIAVDYTLVDCHGNPVRIFDILDQGQYIFIDVFFWHCDGCREIMPYVEEAYTYYGCNKGDVFFMEITNQDHDDKCLLWEEEFDVQYPTIGLDGGSFDYMNLYGINAYPSFIIISPDHTIVYSTHNDNFMITSFQSIKDAFDLFGIEEHQCDISVDEENVMNIDVFPNPADGFVMLTTEGQGVIQVYNAMGQIVDSFVAENEQVKLATEHYPNGLYFIQIDGKGYGRFVVSH